MKLPELRDYVGQLVEGIREAAVNEADAQPQSQRDNSGLLRRLQARGRTRTQIPIRATTTAKTTNATTATTTHTVLLLTDTTVLVC